MKVNDGLGRLGMVRSAMPFLFERIGLYPIDRFSQQCRDIPYRNTKAISPLTKSSLDEVGMV